jgi:hypothetical protein
MTAFRVGLFAIAISIASCSGGGSIAPQPPSALALPGTSTATAAATVVYPAPADPGDAVNQLSAVRLTNNPNRSAPVFDARHAQLASDAARTPLASALSGDHGADGIGIDPGGQYRGLYAIHTAYLATDVQLQSSLGVETLFAPTSHMSDGACLEVGNRYYNAGTSVIAEFYVFNFCSTNPFFAFTTPLDASFETDYVRVQNRDKGNGEKERLPYYVTEIVASNKGTQSLGPTTTWTALLYNHTTRSWDRVYSTVGSTSASSGGWSIFEEYYQAGLCPPLGPKFSVDSLKLYNANNRQWELVAPQMDGKTTSVNPFAQSNCFYNDATGNANYLFFLKTPNDEWEVGTAPQVQHRRKL